MNVSRDTSPDSLARSPQLSTNYVAAGRPRLSHCRELRELELHVKLPTQAIGSLITSITSTNLQKILFSTQGLAETSAASETARLCKVIDDYLCQLVDRLWGSGYECTLEVEFQAWRPPGGSSLEQILPKFRERGRVRVTQSAWRAAHRPYE